MKFTDYTKATEWLFTQIPLFQNCGEKAYKPGLERTLHLSRMFGDPHRAGIPTIHVAGTNGKGSVSSTLAAILQSAGMKTGLFTSPHLLDFRERIRVDGRMIEPGCVVDFLNRWLEMNGSGGNPLVEPSFFELTTIMALDHYRSAGADVAVIEVGLGGRLDSTNIITPDLSVITNISLDHTSLLGDTIAAIAAEKAGIIKPGVPVVVGEFQTETAPVFEAKAAGTHSQLTWADGDGEMTAVEEVDGRNIYTTRSFGTIRAELTGECQTRNAATILAAVKQLRKLGYEIPDTAVRRGFASVCSLTGLTGRWTTISTDPRIICDTGHNPGGWHYIVRNLAGIAGGRIAVIGFVGDKDVAAILAMIADTLGDTDTRFMFTQPGVERALSASRLAEMAAEAGLSGSVEPCVATALGRASAMARESGATVFVGGSNFVVSEALAALPAKN